MSLNECGIDEDEVDHNYRKMLEMLDQTVFTKYEANKNKLQKIMSDPNLDLNEHRDLIRQIASFTLKEKVSVRTFYKYPLQVADEQIISLPKGAQLLTVQVQNSWPYLWALVDTSQSNEERKILICGTGHKMTNVITQYIATFQMENGSLVFHVFEGL